jgi:hypothetical protein
MACSCPACLAPEPKTIDRLLLYGYGPAFVATRWGSLKRQHVKKYRDRFLVDERRQAVEDDLVRMAGVGT